MDEQKKQDDFDDIVVEDGASERGGCLGVVLVLVISAVVLFLWQYQSLTLAQISHYN